MPKNQNIGRPELITLIGNVIVELDVLRASLVLGTDQRTKLDNMRDDLDTAQRKLVRNEINDKTLEFKNLTNSLKTTSAEIKATIDHIENMASTMESLVKFINGVQKIVALMP